MKLILPYLFCPFLLFAFVANAQNKGSYNQWQDYSTLTAGRTAQKITTIRQRLIATSYVKDGILTDTAHYYYSGNRGSYFSNCDSNINEKWLSSYPVYTSSIQVDSFFQRHFYANVNVWEQQYHYKWRYGSNNEIIYCESPNTDDIPYKSNVSHYATYENGLLQKVDNYDTLHKGILTLKSTDYKIYDNRGNLIVDSNFNWLTSHPGIVDYKSYDMQNRIYLDSSRSATTGGIYSSAPLLKVKNSYSNNLDSTTTYEWDGNGWFIYRDIQYSYNSNNKMIETNGYERHNGRGKTNVTYMADALNNVLYMYSNWDTTKQAWVKNSATGYHFNTIGNWDTMYLYRWDSVLNTYQPIEKDVYYYSSSNLVDSELSYWYNTTTSTYADTNYDKYRYYYEVFGNDTAVNNQSDFFVVYPNPNTGQFNIFWNNATANRPLWITVFNSIGQRMFTNTYTWQQNNLPIDISYLPKGVYLLSIGNENGKEIFHQKLVRY